MCQQNPSQIGYFKPILGSFEKSLFFDLPLGEGVGNRKMVVEIIILQNRWKHQKRNVPAKS